MSPMESHSGGGCSVCKKTDKNVESRSRFAADLLPVMQVRRNHKVTKLLFFDFLVVNVEPAHVADVRRRRRRHFEAKLGLG